jgi:trehalose 6-phosphate phosphatase
MSDLQAVLESLVSAYRRGDGLVLLFDYDGTLVPIVEHPRLATLAPEARRLLKRLAGRPRVCLGILSGRAVDDLKQMVRLPNVYYAGVSGLEIEAFGVRLVHPQACGAEKQIATLAEHLRDLAAAFPGAWIENKRLGLTVHYRGANPGGFPALKSRVRAALDPLADQLRSVSGPMAIEITPKLGWTKGTAVRTILQQLGGDRDVVVYAGDGANDVEALEVVAAGGGFALGVGSEAPPAAQYRLPDHVALWRFLTRLDDSLERESLDDLGPSADTRTLCGP